MSSPTSRSLAKLRAEGWTCAVTERWNPYAKIRQDLFGFCDILCIACAGNLCDTRGFLAVQTTSAANAAARVTKIAAEPRALTFLLAGGRIVVHAWAKRGPRGERKVWTCVEREVVLADFAADIWPDPQEKSENSENIKQSA